MSAIFYILISYFKGNSALCLGILWGECFLEQPESVVCMETNQQTPSALPFNTIKIIKKQKAYSQTWGNHKHIKSQLQHSRSQEAVLGKLTCFGSQAPFLRARALKFPHSRRAASPEIPVLYSWMWDGMSADSWLICRLRGVYTVHAAAKIIPMSPTKWGSASTALQLRAVCWCRLWWVKTSDEEETYHLLTTCQMSPSEGYHKWKRSLTE